MNHEQNLKIFITAILLLINQTANAQSILEGAYLLGNLNGVRTRLSEEGIDFAAVYTGDVFSNISGGIRRQTVYLDNIDLTMALNTQRLFNWDGGAIFIYGLGIQGKNPNNYVGDVQTIDNIAAFNTWKLYEAWIQQKLFDNYFSILTGLYDLNSEFQVLQSSQLFINASHGIGIAFSQTGRNGPSIFPNTTLALRVKWDLNNSFYAQSAIFNGTAGDPSNPYGTKIIFPKHDGILSVTEMQYFINIQNWKGGETGRESKSRRRKLTENDYRGKFSAGLWIYSAKFPELGTTYPDKKIIWGNCGFYLIGEYKLLGDKGINDNGLTVFSRIGFSNSKINRFVSYTGFGAVYTGLFSGTNKHQLGIAFAGAHNGKEYILLQKKDSKEVVNSEWNIEITYLYNIYLWLSFQPDIQYVINPDTNPQIKNALVLGIRCTLIL